MRIEPTGTSPVAPKAVGQPVRPAGTAGAAGAVPEGESFAPSGDLASLLAAVRQAPDVRTDAVASAAAQLAAGALTTPAAAADAAKGLLGSGDLAPHQ
jgi:hypothetical protein